MNNNNLIEYDPDAETIELIKRYENVIRRKTTDYFDEEEFEIIMDHYLSLNKSKEAIIAVRHGIAQYPYSNELILRYADILIVRGEPHNALQQLQHVEQMGVNDSDLHFLKGRAFVQLKNFKEAKKCFEKSLQKEAREEEKTRICIIAASDWMEAEEYATALEYFEQAAADDLQNEQLLIDIAYCYEQLNNIKKSKHYHKQCLTLNPFNDTAWFNLGNIYAGEGNFVAAMHAFDFAITANENNDCALFNHAVILMHLGYFKEAISSLTQYLKLEPDNVHALCAIAECYENINYIPQALNCYSKAIKIDAKCATAHYGKGILLMETRDYNQALNHLQQALYIDPNNTEYYYSLGVLLLRANVNDMAMQVFHKITILDPYDIESWLILSELVSNNNIIQGLAVLQQACRHNPANATIHFRIAAFYFILKNRAACVASLKQALSIGGTLKDDFLTICPTAMKYKYIQQIYSRYKK